MAAMRPCTSSSRRLFMSSAAILGVDVKGASQAKFASSSYISSVKPLRKTLVSAPLKFTNVVTRALSGESEKGVVSGLPIDLRGKGYICNLLVFLYSSRYFCYTSSYFTACFN